MSAPQIIPEWPSIYDQPEDNKVPQELSGATILAIGTLDPRPDGDLTLAIDFLPAGGCPVRRIVLGFTELGMWNETDKELSEPELNPELANALRKMQGSLRRIRREGDSFDILDEAQECFDKLVSEIKRNERTKRAR